MTPLAAAARAAAIGAVLVALAATLPSCSVNRRSTSYACDNTSVCDDDRVCMRGFCVERGGASSDLCPAGCTSCDLDDQTCEIDCTDAVCDVASCPAGFACTISCMSPGGCGRVDCSAGTDCEIMCVGPAACPQIQCGTGVCDVGCIGVGACGLLDCQGACLCDQICSSAGSCLASSCPIGQIEVCSEDGTAASPCDSSGRACDRCP